MNEYCPPLFEFPAKSLAWKQAHFVYSWNQTSTMPYTPDYICYNEETCSISQPILYFTKLSESSVILACEIPNAGKYRGHWTFQLDTLRIQMIEQCSLNINGRKDCSATNQFQCGNKCISKHRLVDGLFDCPNRIDEEYNESCALNHKHRLTCARNRAGPPVIKCIPNTNLVMGLTSDCKSNIQLPHFPTLCDSYIDYRENINGRIETDETNCEQWQCDNQYTRCDGIWNCPNGEDETRCFHPVCRELIGHPCLLHNTTEFVCLSMAYINDGIIDCYGGTDEQSVCRRVIGEGTAFLCLPNGTNNQQLTDQ